MYIVKSLLSFLKRVFEAAYTRTHAYFLNDETISLYYHYTLHSDIAVITFEYVYFPSGHAYYTLNEWLFKFNCLFDNVGKNFCIQMFID